MDNEVKNGISGAGLKWIAIITMLIDHSAMVYYQEISGMFHSMVPVWILRGIGRLAFPIFCFLLVEGYVHTGNKIKYGIRLFLFALISEIPFDLAVENSLINQNAQNVFFTLLFGLIAISILDTFRERQWIGGILACVVLFLADYLHTDYGGAGVLLIVGFYIFRNREKACIFCAIVTLVLLGNLLEIAALIAFIPIHWYNGDRGRQMKYFFYAFYPVHLFLLWGLHGGIR